MSNPVFPNTTNTRLWPYGTVREVEVVEVITKPGALVAAVICAGNDEQLIIELPLKRLARTRRGQRGRIVFRPGGRTLGFWDYYWQGEKAA